MIKKITFDSMEIGGNRPLFLIAGPCVIEDPRETIRIAGILKKITAELNIPFIFKSSYDKANRTSVGSFRGPGLTEGLKILREIKDGLGIPVLSDVHRFEEIDEAAEVLDVIQVPAFLCRQTDFIISVARTMKIINVKKGQFLAPWDMKHVIEKLQSVGNDNIIITERGTSFGYNNLVADMRSLPIMRSFGFPVVFDATHSVQLPGGKGQSSGGERKFVPVLARAAVGTGIDGIFLEVHKDPEKALCDGPNSINLDMVPKLMEQLVKIDKIAKN